MTDIISYGIYNIKTKQTSFNTSDIALDFIIPHELVSCWKQCGIIADFVAQYNAVHYKQQEKVISTVSIITNELIENTVRLSEVSNTLISIALKLTHDSILIETITTATSTSVDIISKFIQQLSDCDVETLFLNQLEKVAQEQNHPHGLGLLSVMKDYQASIGIKVTTLDDTDKYNIYTKILIPNTILESL